MALAIATTASAQTTPPDPSGESPPADAGVDAPADADGPPVDAAPVDAAPVDAAPPETPPPPPPTNPACKGKLDGHVVDKATHEPIVGATVTVDGTSASGITDDAGRFNLTELCTGTIVVHVERDDHKPAAVDITVPLTTSVEVLLEELSNETIEIHGKAPDPVSTASTTVITPEQMEKKRGKGFSEALADVPGVSQLRSASGVGKPIIRGQYGRRLLLLFDGIRHRSQEWGLDHAPEIDPFAADTLTVVRGASGVRYGPDAIGGAILANPPELLQEPGYKGELHLIGISNGAGGSVAGRIQDAPAFAPGLSLQLEGTYRRLQGARTPDYALDNTGVDEWSAGARAGYRHGAGLYELSYEHYYARLGVCSCLRIESQADFYQQVKQDRPTGSDLYTSDFKIERPSQKVAHDLGIARATWDLEKGSLEATYALQFDQRKEYDVVRQSVMGPQYDFLLQSHDLDIAFTHEPIHLSDHWHLRGQAGLVGMGQINDYQGLPLIPSHRAIGGGLYAIERLIGHQVELEAGVRGDLLHRTADLQRGDYQRLVRSGQLTLDACTNGADGGEEDVKCTSNYQTFSASVGGVYRFTDELSTKLDVSTSQRPPNPDEQYLNGTSPTFPVYGLGKPDLGPETTYSTSLTTSLAMKKVTFEASGYANVINDYIYFSPALDTSGMPIFDTLIRGTFPRFITHPIDALFLGADGGIAVAPIPQLELGATLSYIRATDRTNNGYLVFIPPIHVGGAVTYKPPAGHGFKDSYITLNGNFTGRQSRYDLKTDFAPPPDAYFLLGAEAGTSTMIDGQTVKFALTGSNLLNQRYRDYTSLLRYFADQPGWQVVARASIHFGGH
ncbi:MAG TPA: TonB-dependent receptor [Kofleriaceae bacterium]|jgi:iron complex outermembrane receptor protein